MYYIEVVIIKTVTL